MTTTKFVLVIIFITVINFINPGNFISLLSQKIGQVLPEPHASLLNGILWGKKADFPASLVSALKKTGTLHLIALSGMNIAILITIIAYFTLFLGRRKSAAITVFLVFFFTFLVGFPASLVRAALMGSAPLINVYFGRQTDSMLTFLWTIAIMIFLAPSLIWDIGFQLSAMATLGIILSGTSAASGFKKELRVTLAAQIFTLPIILINFGQLSLISPLVNILVGWTMPLIFGGGIILALILPISLFLGQILAFLLWPLLSYFLAVVKIGALLPFSAVDIGKQGWLAGLGYYLILLVIYLSGKK